MIDLGGYPMRYVLLVLLFSLVIFTLPACSQNGLFDDTISTIEVQDEESGETIERIRDEAFINDLTMELENANTTSIANIDLPHPDYRVIFLNEDNPILELGYYLEDKNFSGISGRFVDMNEGLHYGVDMELPIQE